MPEEEKAKSRSKSSSKSKEEKHHRSSSKIKENPPLPEAFPALNMQSEQASQKCENCNSNAPINFCAQCDLLLCQNCAAQIHAQPAFQKHVLQPDSASHLARAVCRQHGNRAQSYCVSCQEFVCAKCVEIAHQGVKHQLLSNEAAFAAKMGEIRLQIGSEIAPLREQLQATFLQYNKQVGQLHDAAVQIEQFTLQQADGIVQRLRSAEAARKSKVEPDFLLLAQIIDEIDGLIGAINSSYGPAANQLQLFAKALEFQRTIARAKALNLDNLRQQISQIDYDLPQEMRALLAIKQEAGASSGVVKAKEASIELLSTQLAKLQQTTTKEIEQWEQTVADYAEELRAVSMECCLCGCRCTEATVNARCEGNQKCEKETLQAIQCAEKIIEREQALEIRDALEFVGTQRHHFVRCFK